jgi:negative regulator of sigma E activity
MVRSRAVLAVALALVSLQTAAHANDNPIDHARNVPRSLDFTGQVEVSWNDLMGEHTASLAVSSRQGRLEVDGPVPIVVADQGPMVRESNGWTLVWPGSVPDLASPDLSAKYQLVERPGPDLAGRATDDVEVIQNGQLRERVDVDAATGLLLQRAEFNADGTLVRSFRFDALDVSGAGALRPTPRPSHRRVVRVARVRQGAPFETPDALVGGYRRVGVFRSTDGLQVLYSDGLDTLSVFETPGSLSHRRLAPGSSAARVGAAPAVLWVWPGCQVATWQHGPAVYTVVGDGPLSDVLAAAAALPAPRSLSWSQRLRHASRSMIASLVGR